MCYTPPIAFQSSLCEIVLNMLCMPYKDIYLCTFNTKWLDTVNRITARSLSFINDCHAPSPISSMYKNSVPNIGWYRLALCKLEVKYLRFWVTINLGNISQSRVTSVFITEINNWKWVCSTHCKYYSNYHNIKQQKE